MKLYNRMASLFFFSFSFVMFGICLLASFLFGGWRGQSFSIAKEQLGGKKIYDPRDGFVNAMKHLQSFIRFCSTLVDDGAWERGRIWCATTTL